MSVTLQDKIDKAKLKRSQSIQSKINILWTRDGHTSPDIESQKDIDFFNCQQLFGLSGTEDIDYSHVGVEGLIRCYYHISYLLKGTVRNNIIRNNNYTIPSYCSGTRANLETAANLVIQGYPQNSGFFSSDETEARKGTLDYTDTSFLSNRDNNPADVTSGTLATLISTAIALIGDRSTLGVKTFSSLPSLSQIINKDSILGLRNTDAYPYNYSVISSGGGGGSEGSGEITYTYTYTYGNGAYDSANQTISVPEYFCADPNKWDASWNNTFTAISTAIDNIITYIKYTEVSDTTYFVNKTIIPGISTGWALQEGWISQLTTIQNNITNFFTVLNQYYSNGETNSTYKSTVDSALDTLKSNLSTALTIVNTIHSTINTGSSSDTTYGSGFFGDASDKGATLWGARAQWIKSIIDLNEGSRVVLKGIASVIETMNNSITKNEDDFTLFGITKSVPTWTTSNTWIGGITTPDILGIEDHQTIDMTTTSDTYLELVNDGFTISWQSTAHCTGYDVWKSLDWDGTKGTWTKLLPSGNSFTVQDINTNNGQIYNFYNDLSTDPDTGAKPYYKIKAYDDGGSGDYARIPAESEICDPCNIDDFSSSGTSSYPSSGGTGNNGSSSSSSDGSTTNAVAAIEWKDPVANYLALPSTGNNSGDVRLVLAEATLYYWNADTSAWAVLGSESGSSSSSWKDPVETASFLPTAGNTDGDIRLVTGTGILYRWDSESSSWVEIEGSSSATAESLKHSDLSDMPDTSGSNTDHDTRYYAKSVMDTKLSDITSELDALKYLIPDNAAPLAGLLTLSGRTYSSGYLSHGYTEDQRFDTLSAESYFNKIIKGGSIKLISASPDTQFNYADKGILSLYVNDKAVDQFDLESNFNETYRASNQIYTPATGSNGYLKITAVGMYNNYSKYQRGTFEITLTSSVLSTGENSIKLVHTIDSATAQETDTLIIFYDPSSNAITFDSFDIYQGKLITSKYLSGIRYYGVNDTLHITFQVDKLFNNTYIYPNEVYVDSSQLGITPYWINYSSTGSSYVDFGQPFIDAVLKSDETKTIDTSNVIASAPTIITNGHNLNDSADYTYSENILINTYSSKSDGLNEYFVDETYRLAVDSYNSTPTTIKNQWKSNSLISANDLQVFAGKLQYPKTNYSSGYLPAQTANYYGYSGTRYYIRAFYDQGIPHNNGLIYIEGFNSTSNSYISAEIKLPGQTEWMSLTKAYNEADFNGYATDGCLVNHDTYYYQFTTGKFSTANSGYMLLIRITMTENNLQPITKMSINW